MAKDLFKFFAHLNHGLFNWWGGKNSSYLPDASSLLDTWSINIISHCVGCLFTFSIVSLEAWKQLIFSIKFHLHCLWFLVPYPRNHCLDQDLFLFSSKSVIVLALTFRSIIHLESIFIYGVEDGSDFILLYMDIQFSPYKLLKISLNYLGIFVQNQLNINVWVYFCTLKSNPLIYMSIFMSVPQCLNYYIFVVSLETRK